MSFATLYDAVQAQKGVISTRWLKEQAISLSEITSIREQWSGVLDLANLRGFYIEGPLGPPVPLSEKQSLIVLARSMCNGPLGDHWRRFVYTKELMHVFDTAEEKADSPTRFDLQIEKFGDPSVAMSPQYRAEEKAFWRALMVLCPEARRLEFKAQIGRGEVSVAVVGAALRIPGIYISQLMRDGFEEITSKLK